MRAALAVSLLAANVLAQSFAERVPSDTVAFVSIGDVARLKERARSGALGALWSDPVLEPVTRRLARGLAPARDGDVSVLDLLARVGGEIGVAVLPGGAQVEYVDAGPRTLPFRSLLDLYHAQQARGVRVVETRERVGRHTIFVRRAGRRALAHVWLDRAVCFSHDVQALRRIAAHGGESLAARPAFRAARAAADPAADVFAYVQPSYWLDEVNAPLRHLLGLDGIAAVGATVRVHPDGIRAEVRLATEGPRRGLLKLLSAREAGLGPPPFLPPDVGAAVTVRLDYRDVVTALMGMMRFAPPEQQQMVQENLRALRKLGLDFVRDVVLALGDEVTVAFLPPAWLGAAGSDAVRDGRTPWGDLVILQAVEKPRRIERFMARLDELAGPLPRRDYDGRPVWVLPGARFPVVALLEDHLVLALRVEPVQALIRSRGPGLRTADAYRRAEARVPRERGIFSFFSPRGRSGPALTWLAAKEGLRQQRPELVPLMDGFEKYRDVSAFALSSDDQALRLTWFVGIRDPRRK